MRAPLGGATSFPTLIPLGVVTPPSSLLLIVLPCYYWLIIFNKTPFPAFYETGNPRETVGMQLPFVTSPSKVFREEIPRFST
jgi:hypothetical protein